MIGLFFSTPTKYPANLESSIELSLEASTGDYDSTLKLNVRLKCKSLMSYFPLTEVFFPLI